MSDPKICVEFKDEKMVFTIPLQPMVCAACGAKPTTPPVLSKVDRNTPLYFLTHNLYPDWEWVNAAQDYVCPECAVPLVRARNDGWNLSAKASDLVMEKVNARRGKSDAK